MSGQSSESPNTALKRYGAGVIARVLPRLVASVRVSDRGPENE